MRWLRKERDLIGLVIVWAMMLQSLVLPFTSALHAATLVEGSAAASILCSSRGTAVSPEKPEQNRGPDCQCCHMACRQTCGGGCGGILPTFVRVPLPSSSIVAVTVPDPGTPALEPAAHTAVQPRAPPLA